MCLTIKSNIYEIKSKIIHRKINSYKIWYRMIEKHNTAMKSMKNKLKIQEEGWGNK